MPELPQIMETHSNHSSATLRGLWAACVLHGSSVMNHTSSASLCFLPHPHHPALDKDAMLLLQWPPFTLKIKLQIWLRSGPKKALKSAVWEAASSRSAFHLAAIWYSLLSLWLITVHLCTGDFSTSLVTPAPVPPIEVMESIHCLSLSSTLNKAT